MRGVGGNGSGTPQSGHSEIRTPRYRGQFLLSQIHLEHPILQGVQKQLQSCRPNNRYIPSGPEEAGHMVPNIIEEVLDLKNKALPASLC